MKDIDQFDGRVATEPPLMTALVRHALPFVRRHCLSLATFVILGLIGAIVVLVLLPKQWQGTVVVQVGQISDVGTPQPLPMPIESTYRALERLNLRSFQDEVLKRLGLPLAPGTNENTDLIRKSTQISVLRSSDLLQIQVRAYSGQDAKRFVDAYKELLLSAHAQLIQPSVDKLKSDLSETDRSLANEETRRTELQSLAKEQYRMGVSGKFSEGVLLTDMINKNDVAIRTLRARQINLRELLSPSKTFNSRPLGATDISEQAVFPPKVPIILAGIMLGLLFGLLFSGWRDTRHAV
jgi:hypothetical protein